MNPKDVLGILNELRTLTYFPNDEYVMASLLRLVGSMCRNLNEVHWLVNRMTSGLYSEWPGPQELRACFCSKFRPMDGINAYSTVYLDGIPSERDSLPAIAGRELRALPAGKINSGMSPISEIAVNFSAGIMSMGGKATAAEIASAPQWLRRLEGME